MGQKRLVYSALLCTILSGSMVSPAWSAPITFNTALPVAKGEYLFREQLIFNQSGDDPSQLDRDRTVTAAVSVLGYGINSDLALFGVLPYQDKELNLTVAGNRLSRSASGFADATVFARYTVYKQNKPGQNFRIAPFAGVKMPTGKDNDHDGLGKLPASVQLGSGSWDPLIGVITTYQTLNYQLDGQISYQAKNEANNFEAGDVTRLDGSLQYRLLPKTLSGGGTPGFLYGIIEANWINQQKNRINGVADKNSNGSRLFLSPGIQYVTRRWITEASIQIPISQDLNGLALENDYIGRLSVRVNF